MSMIQAADLPAYIKRGERLIAETQRLLAMPPKRFRMAATNSTTRQTQAQPSKYPPAARAGFPGAVRTFSHGRAV